MPLNTSLIPSRNTRILIVPQTAGSEPIPLEVDGFPETTHKLTVETGEHPVEDGVLVQDHAVARAERIQLKGWVSDQHSVGQEDVSRARAATDQLRRLHRETAIVQVITAMGTYPEMIITDCEIMESGAGIKFDMNLGQVIRVGSEPNEITKQDAGTFANQRTSNQNRGLVAVKPNLFSTESLAAVAAENVRIRRNAEELQFQSLLAQAGEDFARKTAQESLRQKVLRAMKDEAENLAEQYVLELTQPPKRAINDSRFLRVIKSIPGVNDAGVQSRLTGTGVLFTANIRSRFGDFSANHELRPNE